MRIIILSIALLFCALTAHSQVLKSAGVWYFLDVDSMTARPAVLPNGTELAYVVGTKTVYYWNRNTSTWTAYGSTFNRDSINFDASIIGSGTIGDPWGVDSTLFATIAGVGDSIAAAVANYFPLQGGTLTGTGGAGFIGLPSQVSAPSIPASGLNIYAQGSSFNWKGTDGYERLFASTLTGGRTYTLPDVSGTFALGSGTTNRLPLWTATNTLGSSNIQDNGTAVSILNSKPFQLGQWTTAGRPTGTTGYEGYNTTGNGKEWYQGSRWAYALESTFARGTSTRIPHFDANGQITESSRLRFLSNYTLAVGVGVASSSATLSVDGSANFALNDNNDFLVTGVDGNNIFRVTGTNSRFFSFNPNAGNFYGSGVNGEIFQFDAINASIGINLASLTTPFVTIPSNSFMIGGATNGQVVIHDSKNYPFFAGHNVSGTVSQLRLFGGYGVGTNISMDALNFEIVASVGTGTGNPGDIVFKTGNIGSSGTTQHTISNRWWIKGATGRLGNTSSPTEDFDVNGDGRFRDSLRVGTLPNQTSATKILSADASGWIGYRSFSDFATSNIYSADGTTSSNNRTVTLLDSLRFRGSKTVLRIDSLGVLRLRIPSENSTVITHPSNTEDFKKYRGETYLYGTTSISDTTTGTRRNNHGESAFFGANTVEGGNNSYWHAVFGMYNYITGDQNRNSVFGVYNSVYSSALSHVLGNQNIINANKVSSFSNAIVLGDLNTIRGTKSAVIGYSFDNTLSYRWLYGLNGEPNALTHQFYGNIHIGNDSAFQYNATSNILRLSNYGTSATTAAAQSKTESGYLASFATDGTVLSKADNTERYNNITSTTSPVTLSSTIADNLINQGSTQATFTLKMPASPVDGQVLYLTYNNAITTLTIDGNGNTIVGSAVTTAVAGSQRKFKFYSGIGWIKQY